MTLVTRTINELTRYGSRSAHNWINLATSLTCDTKDNKVIKAKPS